LAFNGSLPQILGNPKLKAIYENWLKTENFEKRAIFLRLRMKVLMAKETEMFEIDDRDLGLLKKFSLGIQNAAESVVDGYPKEAIVADFEAQKIDLLKITSSNQQTLRFTQIYPIEFDLDAEIRLLLKITGENSRKIEGPEFFHGLEDLITYDVNFDQSEIPTKIPSKRAIINISEYSMAVKKINDVKVKEETVREVLDTDIIVDDSIAEYEEVALTRIEPINMTEIFVYLGSKSDAIESEEVYGFEEEKFES